MSYSKVTMFIPRRCINFIVYLILLAKPLLQTDAVCQYSSSNHGHLRATCYLATREDYNQLASLNLDTSELLCKVEGRLNQSVANFQSLNNLKKLQLQSVERYMTYQEALNSDAVHELTRSSLFHNLTGLTYLAINLVMADISPVLFSPLRRLETLDISYSMMHVETLRKLLNGIQEYNLPVQTLNMIGTQRLDLYIRVIPIRLKDDIYAYATKLPLKILDLRDNRDVEFQPGLSVLLPQLEVLRVGGSNLLTSDDAHTRTHLACTLLDGMMHPAIKEYVLTFPRVRTQRRPRRDVEDTFRLLTSEMNLELLYMCAQQHGPRRLCGLANCLCKKYINFTCDTLEFVELPDILSRDKACYAGVQIPMPPFLESLVVNHIIFEAVSENIFLCIHPSNRIKYIDLSSNDLGSIIRKDLGISGLQHVTYMNIQHNTMTLNEETSLFRFRDLPSLEVLLLGGNRVLFSDPTEINFLQLRNLRSLDLQSVDLHSMPYTSLEQLGHLEYLNLSSNSLSNFSVNISGLRKLKLLNLSQNNLRHLNREVRASLERFVMAINITLDLSFNPLDCSCANLEFLQWLQSTEVYFARKGSTLCSEPTRSAVNPWAVDLEVSHRKCGNFEIILASVGTSLAAISIIGGIIFLYKKRWKLRYLIHVARESWRNRYPDVNHNVGVRFKYDAFVAYSTHGEERAWVHTRLREKLEEEYGLKLCMYYRDFKLGRDLADTIVEAINASSKTLLILSPTFLNSGWCEFEVRMAHEKVVKERRDSIILVIYNKLERPGTQIPRKLARLLEKKIYVEWTRDPDGEKLFWMRLVKAIKKDSHYDAYERLAETRL